MCALDPVAEILLANLTPTQVAFFNMGKVSFVEAESVADGLGPTMNLDNCGGCHSQPTFGGTSPSQNPQIALARFNRGNRAGNLPSFVSPDGPVRVARFVKMRMVRRTELSTPC